MRSSDDFLIPTSLDTPRLHLRMFRLGDWDDLHKMLSNPECVRFTIKTPFNQAQSWRHMSTLAGHWQLRGYGPYAVVEKASGRVVGPVGLWYPGEWPEPEIKWSLAQEFWGKGYASEAAQAVKIMAAEHLCWERLISLILPDNIRSKAVATRVGARYEKTITFRDAPAEIFAYNLRSGPE